MSNRKGYILQESTDFAFECNGKQYKLSVNIENGLIILKEGQELVPNFIHIIGEPCKCYEEVAREVADKSIEESLGSTPTKSTPQPKKSSKKGKKKKK